MTRGTQAFRWALDENTASSQLIGPFDSVAVSPNEAATLLRVTLLFEFHVLNIFDQTAQKLRAQAAEFFH
jgi:hypothetical protein